MSEMLIAIQGQNNGVPYLWQHEFNIILFMFASSLCTKFFAHIYTHIVQITIHDKKP